MISLDQILLLEQRVESAVAKIAQLQAENDALRSKCSELTNALSSKSEQLSTFESDQNKIESGILKALDRLNSIENSVLKATGQASSFTPPHPVQNEPQEPLQKQPESAENLQVPQPAAEQPAPVQNPESFQRQQNTAQFNTMQPVHQQDFSAQPAPSEDENGQFDIF